MDALTILPCDVINEEWRLGACSTKGENSNAGRCRENSLITMSRCTRILQDGLGTSFTVFQWHLPDLASLDFLNLKHNQRGNKLLMKLTMKSPVSADI